MLRLPVFTFLATWHHPPVNTHLLPIDQLRATHTVRKNLQGFYWYPGSHEVLNSGLRQRCLCPVRSEVGGIRGISIGAVERGSFNWGTVALQSCFSFHCMMKWISYVYTYIRSLLDPPSHLTPIPHSTPLGHHRAPAWALCYIAFSH